MSDNYKTNPSDLLLVMLSQMFCNICFVLVSYIHPESKHSRNIVDGHFPVAKRHFIRFVQDKKFDFVAPVDVVEALNYDKGIKQMATNFVCVMRNGDKMKNRKNHARKEK